MARGKVLTLKEAAAMIGVDGRSPERRLLRLLRAKERELGRPIVVRTGGGRGTRYLVTLCSLRRYMPRFFDEAAELRSEFHRHMSAVRTEVASIVDRIDDLESRIAAVAVELKRLR